MVYPSDELVYFSRECRMLQIKWFHKCNKGIIWAWTLCNQDPFIVVECPLLLEVSQMGCQICRAHQVQVDHKCIHQQVHLTVRKEDKCPWCLGLALIRYINTCLRYSLHCALIWFCFFFFSPLYVWTPVPCEVVILEHKLGTAATTTNWCVYGWDVCLCNWIVKFLMRQLLSELIIYV